jgi:hypothetical protein
MLTHRWTTVGKGRFGYNSVCVGNCMELRKRSLSGWGALSFVTLDHCSFLVHPSHGAQSSLWASLAAGSSSSRISCPHGIGIMLLSMPVFTKCVQAWLNCKPSQCFRIRSNPMPLRHPASWFAKKAQIPISDSILHAPSVHLGLWPFWDSDRP